MQVAPLERQIKASNLPPERLAGSTRLSEKEKVAEVSRQFEAILLRQILGNAQKPIVQSGLVKDSAAAGIYRDLSTQQLAESISKSGSFGLAKTVSAQLSRQLRSPAKPAGAAGSPAANKPAAAPSTPTIDVFTVRGAELLRAPRIPHPMAQPKLQSPARHHE